MNKNDNKDKPKKIKSNKFAWIIIIEIVVISLLFISYRYIILDVKDKENEQTQENPQENEDGKNTEDSDNQIDDENDNKNDDDEEAEVEEPQDQIDHEDVANKEDKEQQDLIAQANRLALGYDYDGAIELLKSYEGSNGDYTSYEKLKTAIEGFETTKSTLVLYGGSYTSVAQFSHIFFHSLIADNAKAFDEDYDSKGYNMYMTTVTEFKNMMQQLYDAGYVLVSMHDIAPIITKEDGTQVYGEGKIYLPEGKKPFVLSQDDVNYYDYMDGDGFASRIVIGEDGKPTCEMILEDGSKVNGDFDMVPILDKFVDEHPDFSYHGAKGILALTGYEGALGYRTDDPTSSTFEQDKEAVKAVAKALIEDGWEFACHTWGHKNMQEKPYEFVVRDTNRWLEEVAPLIGPTDILIFPYGIDIETTLGHYNSDKYTFLKKSGFNYYCGVYKDPWMQIKDDYVRMTRRPLDGQAMLQFPERLKDLFDLNTVIDPERPAKNW
ncbi:MAG: hypothetical protein K0S47_813 [Herbinix sp.]|nr:hypothetical protein [Herbinix sp.]